MFDVLNTCVQNPKPSDAGAEAWAVNYGRAVGNSGVSPVLRYFGPTRSFSSSAVDRCGYRLGPPAKLIAIGVATALCRRFHFVTPSPSGSWSSPHLAYATVADSTMRARTGLTDQ